MSKTKKIILITVSIILAIILIGIGASLLDSHIKYNAIISEEEKEFSETFQKKKDSFNEINDLVLEAVKDNPEYEESLKEYGKKVYMLEFENNKISGLYKFPIDLTESNIKALNRVEEMFSMNFDAIEVSEDRVSYGSDAPQMYVYSRDGKDPSYFFYEDDGVPFTAFKVDDNWYYLMAHIR